MISVVIRARNEAAWLGRCLFALKHQVLPVDDLIFVDNESTDDSLAIAKRYGCRILNISRQEFSFGRALNIGLDAAKNEVAAIISAHCVPADELWSSYISTHLHEDDTDRAVCGVYGRQEPLPDTSDIDARDLWTTFRDERQVQSTDYFFHNANSAVRKSLWRQFPFDESIAGVEDRAWGKLMIAGGYSIVYEPHARVYHYHGIHQGRNEGRARRVAQAIRYIKEQG